MKHLFYFTLLLALALMTIYVIGIRNIEPQYQSEWVA